MADHSVLLRPSVREERMLCRSAADDFKSYYAFPSLCRADADTVRIVYKRGEKHWGDRASSLEQLCWSIPAQRTARVETIYQEEGLTPQMGEIVRMPSGDFCVYIDLQKAGTNQRVGMHVLRGNAAQAGYASSEPLGLVDGVEYGYAFDQCEKDGTVYLLAMTFPELAGDFARSVHVLRSEDSGRHWHFAADLTERFGFPFNESAILPCEGGFYVFTRGEVGRDEPRPDGDYPSGQHLVVLDDDLQVLRMRDYRATTDFFTLTGRPRLFWYDGGLYLLTRQSPGQPDARIMTLDLFRLDPETLDILARIRLDEPRSPGQDGHYGVAYLDESGATPFLCVVTYVTCPPMAAWDAPRPCDLIQLRFDMRALHELGKESK